MTNWKRTERQVAARLGGKRVPVTGRARGDVPDVAHEWLAIEVKHRRRLPLWLLAAMVQARASAETGQLPVVVLHQHGQRHDSDLVVMRLADFTTWFGDLTDPPTPRGDGAG
jgi:hypothetical protein